MKKNVMCRENKIRRRERNRKKRGLLGIGREKESQERRRGRWEGGGREKDKDMDRDGGGERYTERGLQGKRTEKTEIWSGWSRISAHSV